MKVEEQKESRKLRAKGFSIKEIAKKVGVAQSSVSVWVRDIVITEEQKNRLTKKQSAASRFGCKARMVTGRANREKHREAGRVAAKQGDLLHNQGCMLYWAEGAKGRHTLKFCNSDGAMMVLFVNFLQQSLGIPKEKMFFKIYCYDDIVSVNETVSFWVNLLGLLRENMYDPAVNPYPEKSLRKRIGKLKHGVCHISVYSGEKVQHIYGALEVYGGVVIDPLR